MNAPGNHYTYLQLHPSASRPEIEAAIERVSKYANALAATDPARAQQIRDQLRQIKWDLLQGDERRRQYDASIGALSVEPPAPVPMPAPRRDSGPTPWPGPAPSPGPWKGPAPGPRPPGPVQSTTFGPKQIVGLVGSMLLFVSVFLPAFDSYGYHYNYWNSGISAGRFLLLMALLSMVIVLIPQTKRFLWIAGGVALLVTIWDLITLSHVEKVGAQWGVFVVILGALAILASAFVPERGPDGRWTLDI